MAPPLEQGSRDRSTSTGASGLPEHEHKRPRLDTDSDMGIPSHSPPDLGQIVPSPQTNGQNETLSSPLPSNPPPINQAVVALSPTSKVTINTRPLSAHSIVQELADHVSGTEKSSNVGTELKEDSPTMSKISSLDPPSTAAGDAKDPISIASSPSEVVIEIGSPEDIEYSTATDHWSATDTDDASQSLDTLWDTFPGNGHTFNRDIVQALKNVSEIISKSTDERFAPTLRALARWFASLSARLVKPELQLTNRDIEILLWLPNLISDLSKRRPAFADGTLSTDITELIFYFASATCALMQFDTKRLNSKSSLQGIREEQWCLSFDYTRHLIFFIIPEAQTVFHKHMRICFQIQPLELGAKLLTDLIQNAALRPVVALVSLFDAFVEALPPTSAARTLIPTMVTSFRSIFSAILHYKIPLSDQQKEDLGGLNIHFVQAMDVTVRQAIIKQQPWLSIETSTNCLDTASRLMSISALNYPDLAKSTFTAARIETDNFAPRMVQELAYDAYRLLLLRQFIQHGRMELRVSGIEAMANTFVTFWKRIQESPAEMQVVQLKFIVGFLRNNDLVGYLLGIDCHPQVVQRSANVIGFLGVADEWRASDSDMAWNAILENPDHRSVSAIVDMLKQNLQHLRLEPLVHMLDGVYRLQFERIDQQLLSLIVDLLNATIQKAGVSTRRYQDLNAKLIKLCLHLLQNSHTPAGCATEVAEHMREHIYTMLSRERLNIGAYNMMDLTASDKEALMNSVLDSISQHTDHATGSILIATAVIDTLETPSASGAISSTDFAGKLLDDIIFLSQRGPLSQPASLRSVEVEYDIRLKSLEHVIVRLPEMLDASFCEKLGSHLLSSPVKHLRSRTWEALASAFKQMDGSNTVLDYAAAYSMEQLNADLLDKPVLEFCKASVAFELRQKSTSSANKQDCIAIDAMEKIWKVMLETPERNVENEASQYIIRTFLDSKTLATHDSATIQKTHSQLINRCIEIVVAAAQQLRKTDRLSISTPTDDNLVDVGSDREEARLHRALNLLRNFLAGWRSKPQFKPTPDESFGPILKTFPAKGEAVELKLNIANHSGMRSGILQWTVGEENTGHELWRFLMDMTGWGQIMIIKSGARLQLQDASSSVKDLHLEQAPLFLSKPLGSSDIGPGRAIRGTSPIDSTIMHHFDDLYALLECRETIAKDIYEFLAMFPSEKSVITEIKSQVASAASLLPVDRPFKLLYYANVMRSHIEEESFSQTPDAPFLQYAIQIAASTLPKTLSITDTNQTAVKIINALLELLQLALRAKVSVEASASYFQEPEVFASDLLNTWVSVQYRFLSADNTSMLNGLDAAFLDVALEASLHDQRLWHYIKDRNQLTELLVSALLTNGNSESRKSSLEVIGRLAGVPAAGKQILKPDDSRSPRGRFSPDTVEFCLQQLWSQLWPLVPKACAHPLTCQQALEACVVVLDNISAKLDSQNSVSIFSELKDLLLQHRATVVEQSRSSDDLVSMLARMMISCTKAFKADSDVALDLESLVTNIWQGFLVPPLSDVVDASLSKQVIPVLDATARTALYELVLAISQNTQKLGIVVAELRDSTVDQDHFRHWTSNERKALRSEQGFAGIHNLSNTCYLNSLFTQLFMNIRFRELVIGINIIDPSKQQLMYELGALFAHMQSSQEKYIDPTTAVGSIMQYNGEEIDVTVQMDVDEFFNLLFDRLEAQILDAGSRQAFKSLYGGQLVQQIKSKECEHVSERLEPFSAVQVEIKGKTRLEDGLAAYVEGETLQGENKYSCTGCGKHVDAVKRACLKELPDNLIFNLKRFDYDIFTGVRTKINDEFQFPNEINMTPYTLDALSDPEKDLPDDFFELVGVIVHSGTAETGHYYSFIRRRPSPPDLHQSWVQFNDQDVTSFEPEQLKDQAFGGYDSTFSNFPKFYNGYMLFYERRSSLRAGEREKKPRGIDDIITAALPAELDNRIALENEICLRRYVTQDPSHARFVRRVTERICERSSPCSQSHELEDQLLYVVLDYIQQVSSRWKETPEVEDTIKPLLDRSSSCARCALQIVEWFVQGENLVSNILRAFYPQARKNFAALFFGCWSTLSPLRHISKKESTDWIDPKRIVHSLALCLRRISEEWTELQKFPRGWAELFGLLIKIAKLGEQDATMLLEHELLALTAEIVWVHADPKAKGTPVEVRRKYLAYLNARDKNRTFNHGVALDLFAELFQHVALTSSTTKIPPGITVSREEESLLVLRGHGSLGWLHRLIGVGSNATASAKVVKELCYYSNQLLQRTSDTLLEGLNSRQYLVGCRFIQPSLIFIQHCSDKALSSNMIKKALEAVAESDGYYSIEHLDFVQALFGSDGTASLSKEYIHNVLRDCLGDWAPALLIAPTELQRDTRGDAFRLVQELLFRQLEVKEFVEAHSEAAKLQMLRGLAQSCNEYVTKNFLTAQGQDQAERSNLSVGQSQYIILAMQRCIWYMSGDEAEDEAEVEDDDLMREIYSTIEALKELEQSVEMLEFEEYREPSSEPMSDMESFGSP